MAVYRYPANRILADYFLGIGGMAMSGGLLALAASSRFVLILFGGLTGVFLLFTIYTTRRQRLRIAADGDGIQMSGGWVRSLRWDEVETVTLRYFSARRNRKGGGWMTLTLRGRGQKIAFDSHLEGFEALARKAGEVAVQRNLPLDSVTASNFAALDVGLKSIAA
jgi:hypothetical protein